MASVSGATTSLGNTSLRGFGGLASGIDRDSIIEQMSLATNTKIQNQKNSITSLTWKQEAYRSVIDKILDLQDNYLSYSASSNMLDPAIFSKSVITANGDEKVTKYLTASGSSELLDYMSVRGVESLATAANVQSKTMTSGEIKTGMGFFEEAKTSNLEGKQLIFGQDQTEGRFNNLATFTFYSSYKDENGVTQNIDYTASADDLAKQLNAAIKANKFTIEEHDNSGTTLKFTAVDDKLVVNYAKATNIQINDQWDASTPIDDNKGYIVRSNSSALSALGFTGKDSDDKDIEKEGTNKYGYKLSTVNAYITKDNYEKNSITRYANMAEFLKGKKFTVTYGGTSKSVELITSSDAAQLKTLQEELDGISDKESGDYKGKVEAINTRYVQMMQTHLDQAFGKDKIEVGFEEDGKVITFDNEKHDGTTLTVSANNWAASKVTGLDKMNSNKVSLDSSLFENRERLGLTGSIKVIDKNNVENEVEVANMTKEQFNQWLKQDGNGFEINGVKIDVNCDTTINQLMNKVNSSAAGVRMNYLSTSNKFTLTSKETGSGRRITFGDSEAEVSTNIAARIFGAVGTEEQQKAAGYSSKDGTDAVLYVDYGTGIPEKVVSSSNTFDLDGLKVTVSGTFGLKKDEKGDVVKDNGEVTKDSFDTSQAITFDAKANVDNAVEKVKKFIEDFNALVKEVNTQITTKPDSDYGPLTDEQKDEMSETSIENWEKKAKEGLLYNNASMRDLSMDMQGILTKLMGNGVSYEDLEEIGITASQDIYDGGTLVFDESKFRAAMESNPEKVGNIIAGGGNVKKGLGSIMNDSLKTYATRYAYLNGGSYGRLVEEAGSEKISLSVQSNTIYNQLKDMQEVLTDLRTRLKSEQDRYIRQFTQMEQAISNMNSQSSYLSSIGG